MDAVDMEQRDYMNRLKAQLQSKGQFPSGVADNAMLRENVFFMLVGIVNRIAVFMAGEPGSGKSMAYHLVNQALQGEYCDDLFLRQHPLVVTAVVQGSKQSTSKTIAAKFKEARQQQRRQLEQQRAMDAHERERQRSQSSAGVQAQRPHAVLATKRSQSFLWGLRTRKPSIWLVVLEEMGLAEASPSKPLKVSVRHTPYTVQYHRYCCHRRYCMVACRTGG